MLMERINNRKKLFSLQSVFCFFQSRAALVATFSLLQSKASVAINRGIKPGIKPDIKQWFKYYTIARIMKFHKKLVIFMRKERAQYIRF